MQGTVGYTPYNEGAVAVVNSGYSKNGQIMHLMRCLFFIVANYQILLMACHIPGAQNGAADVISRDNLPRFFSLLQVANPTPTPVPDLLVALLVTEDIDSLVPVVQELFSAGMAASSMKVYRTGHNRYAHFCERYSILPFPTSEDKLSQFVALGV